MSLYINSIFAIASIYEIKYHSKLFMWLVLHYTNEAQYFHPTTTIATRLNALNSSIFVFPGKQGWVHASYTQTHCTRWVLSEPWDWGTLSTKPNNFSGPVQGRVLGQMRHSCPDQVSTSLRKMLRACHIPALGAGPGSLHGSCSCTLSPLRVWAQDALRPTPQKDTA
jgi:hypothetical protein